MRHKNLVAALIASALMAACGGGDHDSHDAGESAAPGVNHGGGAAEEEIILQANTYVIPSEIGRHSVLDRTAMTLTLPLGTGTTYKPQDVLISEFNGGLLAKVDQVYVDPTTKQVTYTYTYANLAEAFEVFKVNFEDFGDPTTLGEWKVGDSLSPNVTVAHEEILNDMQAGFDPDIYEWQSKNLYQTQASTFTPGSQKGLSLGFQNVKLGHARVQGYVQYESQSSLKFDLDKDKNGNSVMHIDGKISPFLRLSLNAKYARTQEDLFEDKRNSMGLFNRKSDYKVRFVSFVPVVYQWYTDVDLKGQNKMSSSYDMNAGGYLTGDYSASYHSDNGFNYALNKKASWANFQLRSMDYQISSAMSLPSVNVGVMLYSMAGAHIGVANEMEASSKGITNLMESMPDVEVDLQFKARAYLGFKVNESVSNALEQSRFVKGFFNDVKNRVDFWTGSLDDAVDTLKTPEVTLYEHVYAEQQLNFSKPSIYFYPADQKIDVYVNGNYFTNLLSNQSSEKSIAHLKDLPVGTYKIKFVHRGCAVANQRNCNMDVWYKFGLSSSPDIAQILHRASDGSPMIAKGSIAYLSFEGQVAEHTVYVKEYRDKFPGM